ncbi:immunoglobulin kappa light chain-like [Gambusia affinis]|uniref:immunoglobulin kappa light chain-like n=1 Tax=Gambusia affinis TaxID=33528 RepID=UPI001CDBAE5A|nr:immunoglobulin kappa light chain-like [Gambusia affinis]
MDLPVCAGYATFLLLGNLMFATGLVPSSSGLGFEAVSVGRDVTLKCSYQENSATSVYWYKQSPGRKPQLMSEFLKHASKGFMKSPFNNDPRFQPDTGVGKNNLKIFNVQTSDSAVYYCVSGHSFQFDFLEGIIFQVKDLALDLQTSVYQPELETIHPGDSAVLNCTVHSGIGDGEHRVYWLKNSDESNPRIIYAQGDRRNQCEMKPNSQTHTCVYKLPLENLNVSHAGTYYCAVAACGYILLGNGTKLDYKEHLDSPVLLYVLTGTLAFVVVLMGLLAYKSHKLFKTKKRNHEDPPERSPAAPAPKAQVFHLQLQDSVDAGHLHYATVSEKNVISSGTQSEASGVCTYSTLKQ